MVCHDCKIDPPNRYGKFILVYVLKIAKEKDWTAACYSPITKLWKKIIALISFIAQEVMI